jgi:alpha-tubulin suppressor-like RCC1 family protein
MAMQSLTLRADQVSAMKSIATPRRPVGVTWLLGVAGLLCMPLLTQAQPVPLDNVSTLSAGSGHSCGALGRGGVRCWGNNFLGQLGDGTRTDRLLPVSVSELPQRVVALANGEVHSCAILQGGAVRCWGMNFYGQLGDGTDELGLMPVTPIGLGSGVQQIGGGENHTCALTAAGGVKCWGANYSGQLGDGSGVDARGGP